MAIVSIENLILEGIHGVGHIERQRSQRFAVTIQATAGSLQAAATDLIDVALDYRQMKKAAERIVESEQHCLLETIAERIAAACLEVSPASTVTVSVRKLEIWPNCVPAVTVTRRRLPRHLDLLDFDSEEMLDHLSYFGGYAMPILPEQQRLRLLEEAEHYHFVEQPEVVAGGLVREQVSSIRELPPTSLFHQLKTDFTELLRAKLGSSGMSYFFPAPSLEFSELSLQLYEQGSIGITPHLDGKSMLNLICVFTLTGAAKFALCDDRLGSNPRYLDTTPGNVTIMRSPGFLGSAFQPFHFVSEVTERRIVFGLRQKRIKNSDPSHRQ